jgi:transcriptional regulator with XRE-family HTH domain
VHTIGLPFANVNTPSSRRQAEVEALGKSIQAERTALGLTLDGLAERTGLHRNTIHDYEKGKKEVPFGKLVDIADALGMTVLGLVRIADDRRERDERFKGASGKP